MRNPVRLSIAFMALLSLVACGSTSRTVTTLHGPAYSGAAFKNILVIGVADSYNNRTTFERTLAKDISTGSTAATAYYSLTKMDDPIDLPAIEKVIATGDFDAVLITRAINREIAGRVEAGKSDTKVTRKHGGAADLFRYDYEDLNEPTEFSMEINVVITSELFSVATREKVWAIESDVSDQSSVGVIVIDAANVVASELRKAKLIAK